MDCPQFRRFRPTVVLPDNVESDMLTKPLHMERRPWWHAHSYLFYEEIEPQVGTRDVTKTVMLGYWFHLDGLRVSWPATDGQGAVNPVPRIVLFHGVRHRQLYDEPLQMELHTTPAGTAIARYYVRDNVTLIYRDWFRLAVSNMAADAPAYVRIAAIGTNIPRETYTL